MLGLTEDELDRLDSIADLMEDASTSHGWKVGSSTNSAGESFQTRRSLSCEDAAHYDYAVAHKGVTTYGRRWFHSHGMRSDREGYDSTRTLSRRESDALSDSDRLNIKARVLAKMGFTLSQWARLSEVPCRDKQLVAKFDAAVYDVKTSGGRINDLARALDIPLKKGRATTCPRLQLCIRRHRKRMANPEDFGTATCAAKGCTREFYRVGPNQRYCGTLCQKAESNRRMRAMTRQRQLEAAA